MEELNDLRTKYGLGEYDLDTFLMGGNPEFLPSVAEKADHTEYGRLLRAMNSMRASAQGIYIHNQVKLYCQANALSYSGEGVDVTAPATSEYAFRHYEVLRDTSGSWVRHYRDTMVVTPWRAITYS
jgi:hypothetical protein